MVQMTMIYAREACPVLTKACELNSEPISLRKRWQSSGVATLDVWKARALLVSFCGLLSPFRRWYAAASPRMCQSVRSPRFRLPCLAIAIDAKGTRLPRYHGPFVKIEKAESGVTTGLAICCLQRMMLVAFVGVERRSLCACAIT